MGGMMPKGAAEGSAVCSSLQFPAELGNLCWWDVGLEEPRKGAGWAAAPIPCSVHPSPRPPRAPAPQDAAPALRAWQLCSICADLFKIQLGDGLWLVTMPLLEIESSLETIPFYNFRYIDFLPIQFIFI